MLVAALNDTSIHPELYEEALVRAGVDLNLAKCDLLSIKMSF